MQKNYPIFLLVHRIYLNYWEVWRHYEGLGSFLFAILAASILILFGWALILVSWYLILFLAAIFYWILYRAVRLVLKYSMRCQGNLALSLRYSLFYTFLYSFWMYGIILALHYIQH